MKEYYKQVCVKIATDVQYDSLKPVLKMFKKNKTPFDIFIPEHTENTRNINKMFDKTYKIVSEDGFSNIIRKTTPDNQYHLALITPNYEQGISAKYYIKYSYGPAHTVKPSTTHQAYRLNRYHGYFLHSKRDLEIFSVFSKTYLLPDLKYIGYKHAQKTDANNKQTILFLPSWEGQNSLNWIVSAVKKLNKDYNTIVKLHPYGDFGSEVPKSVKNVKAEIREVTDEYYEGEAALKPILERSNLIVSDVSGAVFDALYVGVPVTLYSKNIYKFDLAGIKSACAKYVDEGYISLSKTASALVKEIPNALSDQYLKKQLHLSKEVFCQDFTPKAVDSWMKVINYYLNDDVNQEYVAMHDLMSSEFWHFKNEAERLSLEVQNLDNKVSVLTSKLNSFLGVGRSARLLAGNIMRRAKRLSTINK